MKKMTLFDFAKLDSAMIRIPQGKGIIGITTDQQAAFARQAGVHPDMLKSCCHYQEVESNEFWMDRYPVTRAQYRRFLQATGYQMAENGWLVGWVELTGWPDFSSETDALPMVGVNVSDAAAYAAWCNKRLPTDIEWERAWRGDDGRLFPWGNTWQDGFVFCSPGNISLRSTIPVGASADTGPFGLGSYGLVLEWVRSTVVGSGENTGTLAGGSFLHTQQYSFLPSNRSQWHDSMRMYNTGFRCVADRPPTEVDASLQYCVEKLVLPMPVSVYAEAYRREPIKLRPQEWASVLIEVPWFPESIWVLDCPEGTWSGFGGANAWPGEPRKEWLIPWKVRVENNGVTYLRERGEQSQVIEVWVDGATVHYRYWTSHIEANPASFCFKSFSPFFTSQERRLQCVLDGERVIPCDTMPLQSGAAMGWPGADHLSWTVGEVKPPSRFALMSFNGKGRIILPERTQRVGGNGFYPCIHVNAADDTGQEGSGSFEFNLVG